MDFSQYVLAAPALVGFVNGIKLATDRQWKGFVLFSAAVGGGIALGFLHWFGVPSPEIGFMLGLASSGTYEIAQRVGGD